MKKQIFLCTAMIFLVCAFPSLCISGASDGINTCLKIVIPSLFPFFVVSKMFIMSGGAGFFGKYLGSFMKLFNIGKKGAAPFVLGIVSGYPIGAYSACDMYKRGEITRSEAQNLLAFCNNSGPCFLIGAIGVQMLGSKNIGYALYAIHILSSISVGIALRKKSRASSDEKISVKADGKNVFTRAVEESVLSMMSVCGYIVFFSVVIKFLECITQNSVICGFFEMTTAVKNLCAKENIPFEAKFVIISFLCGWAGLSVNMQTKKIIDDASLSFKGYLFGKSLHAVFAFIYSFIFVKIFPYAAEVFLPIAIKSEFDGRINIFLCIIILLMYVLYVLKMAVQKV